MKFLRTVNSLHASSLGLHPLVYFYNKRGNHIYSSILAWVDVITEITKSTQSVKSFLHIRNRLELFLISNKHFITNINTKYGSGLKSHKHISKVITQTIRMMLKNETDEYISEQILSDYPFLTATDEVEITSSKFSGDVKSQIYIHETLPNSSVCSHCKGFIHTNSITFDHVLRKRDGGKGSASNGALMHPYCNTGAKN